MLATRWAAGWHVHGGAASCGRPRRRGTAGLGRKCERRVRTKVLEEEECQTVYNMPFVLCTQERGWAIT